MLSVIFIFCPDAVLTYVLRQGVFPHSLTLKYLPSFKPGKGTAQYYMLFVCFFWGGGGRDSPAVGQGFLIHEVSRSHTTTHHSRYGSSARVISPSQRPLPDNTHTNNRQISMPRRDSKPVSAGERPRTYTLDRAATGTGIICCSIVTLQEKSPHLNALT